MAGLQVRRIAYALGAEVTGVDLAGPIDDAALASIRRAWHEHLLLCFPGQKADLEALLAFAKRLGPLEFVFKADAGGTPHAGLLSNKPVNGEPRPAYKAGQNWHTDKSFTTLPTSATLIQCKEIPPVGGDTMFANMYMAYETLSPKMQKLIEGLWAIHDASAVRDAAKVEQQGGREGIEFAIRERAAKYPPTVQPVVRVHPETKRKALYLGERVRRFVGMTEEESLPLMRFLNRHSVRYEFCYRHRWSVDDVVMWDNRCMMHIALCDYDLTRDVRHMIRLAVSGEPCGRLYAPEDDAAAAVAAR